MYDLKFVVYYGVKISIIINEPLCWNIQPGPRYVHTVYCRIGCRRPKKTSPARGINYTKSVLIITNKNFLFYFPQEIEVLELNGEKNTLKETIFPGKKKKNYIQPRH
jgi:hypothetical protein